MFPLFLSKSSLPGEMIMEILCNLSIREVTILRVVSKNWNNSISDPTFHRWHIQKEGVKESMLFFHRMVSIYPFSQSSLFILPPNQYNLTQLPSPVNMDLLFPLSIAGVVNGVICYRYKIINEGVVVCLWNPVTGQNIRLRSLESHSYLGVSTISFGYDNASFSFVVVLIWQSSIGKFKHNWISTYHVKSDHLSSRVLDEIESEAVGDRSVYVDNHICWFGFKFHNYIGFPRWLISYNLIDGKIREYQLPPTRINIESMTLTMYDGKVCLIRYQNFDEESVVISLWTLPNLCNKYSKFERILSFGPISAVYSARLITHNHIIVIRTSMFEDGEDAIHYCHGRIWNLQDNSLDGMFFHGLSQPFRFCFVGEFCNSLFSF